MTDKQCGKKAKARFTWGGIGEESYCCAEHGQQLQSLCDHMGWQQIFIALPEDTEKTCLSMIEIEATNE